MKENIGIMIFIIIGILVMFSCSAPVQKQIVHEPDIENFLQLSTEVNAVNGNRVSLSIQKPGVTEKDLKLAFQLAQGIINQSYLLEGTETLLDQYRVKILRVKGNNIIVEILDDNHKLTSGIKSKIYINKKTIAIKDFEVIIGTNKSIAQYVQEDITTVLANSGYFNVVERVKLKSVLDELKLSQSGSIDPDSAKQVGKLLGADIILTGTLAATGDEWNTNLRLINTETGLITAAFNKRGPLHDLKPAAFREIKNIEGSFENKMPDMTGWVFGEKYEHQTGKDGFQKVYIDDRRGANGTNSCLAMDFKLGEKKTRQFKKKPIVARITNMLTRDLTQYSGIEFYIKGSKNFTLTLIVTDRQKDLSWSENWFYNLVINMDWEIIKIPFNSLALQLGKAQKFETNQILETGNIIKIEWTVHEFGVERGTEGTIWIDEVSFY